MKINNSPEEKEQAWESQKHFLSEFKEKKAGIFFSGTQLAKAFRLDDRSLRCIDEGTPGGLHLAGSGLVLGIEAALQFAQTAMIDGVYSHMGCDAAALFTTEKGVEQNPDEVAENWAKELAQQARVPYLGQINLTNLNRPSHLHDARVAYYDGSGRFDFSKIEKHPSGFTISRRYLVSDYARREVEIALSIAFGEHGFGDLFTKEEPFYLIAIGNGENENGGLREEELKEELLPIASSYEGRVVVDSFSAVF